MERSRGLVGRRELGDILRGRNYGRNSQKTCSAPGHEVPRNGERSRDLVLYTYSQGAAGNTA